MSIVDIAALQWMRIIDGSIGSQGDLAIRRGGVRSAFTIGQTNHW